MKVLFLDIDGVLNSADYMHNRRHLRRPTGHAIDAPTIPRLNAIVERTGAKVVISSSWRIGFDTTRMAEILREHGFTGEVIDSTPTPNEFTTAAGVIVGAHERGHEIQMWLDEHPGVERFAIVDDGSDMAHLAPRLVQTTWAYGLLDEHVDRLVAMLAPPPTLE